MRVPTEPGRPIVAYDDEPLRMVVYRMAETGFTRLPVVRRDGRLLGVIALTDLLVARTRILEAERRRERVLGRRVRLPRILGRRRAAPPHS
jgi:chloride channel protein, CIC family